MGVGNQRTRERGKKKKKIGQLIATAWTLDDVAFPPENRTS